MVDVPSLEHPSFKEVDLEVAQVCIARLSGPTAEDNPLGKRGSTGIAMRRCRNCLTKCSSLHNRETRPEGSEVPCYRPDQNLAGPNT